MSVKRKVKSTKKTNTKTKAVKRAKAKINKAIMKPRNLSTFVKAIEINNAAKSFTVKDTEECQIEINISEQNVMLKVGSNEWLWAIATGELISKKHEEPEEETSSTTKENAQDAILRESAEDDSVDPSDVDEEDEEDFDSATAVADDYGDDSEL